MDEEERLPHAVLDLPSRRWKAMKIERLMALESHAAPVRMLEVGVGAGGIAHYFATHESGKYEVQGVDVLDSRMVHAGYGFTQVEGTQLPFPNQVFDIVLSNHVIEHVGPEHSQMLHLAELRRVLAPEGAGYLAVPNRWMLVEPHYRLAFLSWLPVRLRTPFLRVSGKGEVYDCRPLERRQLERMLAASGFGFENLCIPALRATFDIEQPNSLPARLAVSMPDALLRPLRGIIPTLIYRFWHLPGWTGDA